MTEEQIRGMIDRIGAAFLSDKPNRAQQMQATADILALATLLITDLHRIAEAADRVARPLPEWPTSDGQ